MKLRLNISVIFLLFWAIQVYGGQPALKSHTGNTEQLVNKSPGLFTSSAWIDDQADDPSSELKDSQPDPWIFEQPGFTIVANLPSGPAETYRLGPLYLDRPPPV